MPVSPAIVAALGKPGEAEPHQYAGSKRHEPFKRTLMISAIAGPINLDRGEHTNSRLRRYDVSDEDGAFALGKAPFFDERAGKMEA
jgi:hypothetical protein